jgi:hypothetical protein
MVRVLQHACAAAMTAHAKTVHVMLISARAKKEGHVSVPQAVLRRAATKAAVKLPLNRVAVRKVNVQLNKTESNCTM